MRRSYYNVLAKLPEGRGVLYHTYHQSLVELDADDMEKLEALDSCCDDGFVKALADARFLVDDPEAEADLMLYRQHSYRNNSKVFEIAVSPTRECNFHCDYCYVKKRPGVMSEQVQDRLMDFAAYHFEQAPFQKLIGTAASRCLRWKWWSD